MYCVIADASDLPVAQSLGINYTQKLANAGATAGVQHSTATNVPGDVDFWPSRVLVPSSTGFPPLDAAPGAMGRNGYSPLVQLPSGVALNAPQVGDGANTNDADKSHWADKVASVDAASRTLRYRETTAATKIRACTMFRSTH